MKRDPAKKPVLLCTGSRCTKALRRDDGLQDSLREMPVRVRRVGCQKICRGPLVGVSVSGRWEWFERMDSAKAARALGEFLEGGALAKPLQKRHRKKASGRLRD